MSMQWFKDNPGFSNKSFYFGEFAAGPSSAVHNMNLLLTLPQINSRKDINSGMAPSDRLDRPQNDNPSSETLVAGFSLVTHLRDTMNPFLERMDTTDKNFYNFFNTDSPPSEVELVRYLEHIFNPSPIEEVNQINLNTLP